MSLPPLPAGIQTFRKIIQGGFTYVDKTQHLYPLVASGSGSYFWRGRGGLESRF